MSYGCAGRRDERRQGAIERHTRKIQAYKDLLANKTLSAQPNIKYEGKTNGQVYAMKLARNEEALAGTRANIGKGTAAMYKSN